ncbi:ras-related protein ORAB-1-like [Pecten maximus]|uniref:ras-related protein ORAB-1-like n=1 Tax=Pecten maximus TaxID=6579 RepID=UPI001458E407|nr:ras-related protein ORAB-1-like [Pecten maximus]
MSGNKRAESPPPHQPYNRVYINQHGEVGVDLMLIGDYNAGKTSIIQRFVEGTFDNNVRCTMGHDFTVKHVWIDRSEVNLRLWDTYGGERYRGPGRSYYRHCHCVIIVYDVTNICTFENIEKIWLRNIEEYGSNDLAVMIMGTKCDLPGRQVDYVTAKKFADSLDIPLIETSSLTGYGIDRAIMSGAAMAMDKLLENVSNVWGRECSESYRKADTSCQLT